MKNEKILFANSRQDGQLWVCPECEMENDIQNTACALCGQARPTVMAASGEKQKPAKYNTNLQSDQPKTARRDADLQPGRSETAPPQNAKKRMPLFGIITLILLLCLAIVYILTFVVVPMLRSGRAEDFSEPYTDTLGDRYDRAIQYIEDENYEDAYLLLNGLHYQDSDEIASDIYYKYQIAKMKSSQVGDIVYYGSYEQDNNLNEKEEIGWLVLEKKADRILLLSEKALDLAQYHESAANVTWETCSVRKWLNSTFLNEAFQADEQESILCTSVTPDRNPYHNTDPGKGTNDKVFLLSAADMSVYFNTDEARKCIPTPYALSKGVWISDDFYKDGCGTCYWWLRSPGSSQNAASIVHSDGKVSFSGYGVEINEDGIRPAIWISLE